MLFRSLAGMATPVVGPTARLPPVGGLARYLLVLAGIAALAFVTVVAIGGLSVPGAQLRSGSELLDG